MDHTPLIYGKSEIQKVINLEVHDDFVRLFILNDDGSSSTKDEPNLHWILSSNAHDSSWIRLKGNLHYKFGKQFSSRKDLIEYRKKLGNADLYQIYDPKEACMVNKGITYFKGLKPKDIPILSFDIETTGLDPAAPTAKVLLISNTLRNKDKLVKRLFAFDEYKSEGAMIDAWVKWVNEMDPSIITGHNIIGYDLHYMNHRAKANKTALKIGRDGSEIVVSEKESSFRVDGSRDMSYHKKKIYGREVIDTMFLAYRYDIVSKKYESYGLKSIIKTEGMEKEGRQFYDAAQIRFKYNDPVEWAKIKAYCVDDADDSLGLFDLMSPAQFYMTQSIPRSFQSVHESATGAQINGIMVRAYLQDRHSIPKADASGEFTGALSDGFPGIYRNSIKWDISSLYPSIMRNYKVFDKDKDPDGYFLKITDYFTLERLKNKKLSQQTGDKYYDDLQGAQKIFANSLYGVLGAGGLNFNSIRNASYVTEKGREILKKAITWASGNDYVEGKLVPLNVYNKGFTLVNLDTDAITVCKKDQSPFEKEEQNSLLIELNSLYPELIRFEPDGYFKCVVVIKAKNYIMQYDNGKVKIKGSALKASTKCPAEKELIQRIINAILKNEDNFEQIYQEYVQEALNVKDIKRWASRKTIGDKILDPQRTNEQKVFDIIQGTEYVEGDRIHTFFMPDGSLCLVEKFNGTYSKSKLLEQIYKTSQVFESVLPTEILFKNYSLGKYFKELCPEEASVKKQVAAQKRKEAQARKALQTSEQDVMMMG